MKKQQLIYDEKLTKLKIELQNQFENGIQELENSLICQQIAVKKPEMLTQRFPQLESQHINYLGVECLILWCRYCCFKVRIGNRLDDLKNGSIIPCDTRGSDLWKFTQKCYKHVMGNETHISNFLESKTRGVGNEGKETMKRLVRIGINNVRDGGSNRKYERDVVHAHLNERHINPNKYGNRYHRRDTARQIVQLGGRTKLREIRSELNTTLLATQDKPHFLVYGWNIETCLQTIVREKNVLCINLHPNQCERKKLFCA
eukprot:191168_1